MTMRITVSQFAGVAGLGATAAAFGKVNPLVGAGMASIAGLVAWVAQPMFDAIQESEQNMLLLRNKTAFWTLVGCFSLGVAQIAQAVFSSVGCLLGGWQAIAIVAPSWMMGPLLGEAVYQLVASD